MLGVFATLGRLASRRPWIVIAAWVVFAGLVIAFAPSLKTTTDQAEFLPDSYDSIKAATLQADEFPDTNATIGAIVVFDREDGEPLTDEDLAAANEVMADVGGDLGPAFDSVQPLDPSQPESSPCRPRTRAIAYSIIGLADDVTGFEESSFDSVEDLRTDLGEATRAPGSRPA